MSEESLYFIAIVPNEPVYSFVLSQKQYFAEKYNSKGALRSPPHITLHMPFKLKQKRMAQLISSLRAFAENNTSFEFELDGFGSFQPRVIFVDVKKSNSLTTLQNELADLMKKEFNLFNSNHRNQPFHPHMTVAFRDLKKSAFYESWSEYAGKKYNAQFMVNDIVLLKHDGQKWGVEEKFGFKTPNRLQS